MKASVEKEGCLKPRPQYSFSIMAATDSEEVAGFAEKHFVFFIALLSTACGAPPPPPGTGGTSVAPGRCGRGVVVVGTDYQSTNVSLMSGAGEVLSASFVSSASASPGLSAPLSGDVVLPTEAARQEVTTIDRFPAAVLSFLEIETAVVRAQLVASTGFAANPQDYLRLSDAKAYVTRFETNRAPGLMALDQGGDVLIIDPRAPALVGRIDLSAAMADALGFLPRANRMVVADGMVVTLLSAYDAEFNDSAPSRVVTIDPLSDRIVGVTTLTGLHGCAGLAVTGADAPTTGIAVACSGKFDGSSASADTSGVVMLAVESGEVVEQARFRAVDLVGQPLGFSLDFATPTHLLLTALGSFASDGAALALDVAFELDTTTGAVRELVRSAALPFELGEVRCMSALWGYEGLDASGCGFCWVADAERGVLHRLRAGATGLEQDGTVSPDPRIGLPPRVLGRF